MVARLCLLMNNLGAGGAEVSMLRTAARLIELGHEVDLVVCEKRGPLLDQVPDGVRLVELEPGSMTLARLLVARADPDGAKVLARPIILPRKPPHRLHYLASLARYLKDRRPAAMLSALTTPNMLAIWARRLSGVPMRVVVSHRNTLSAIMAQEGKGSEKWRKIYLPQAIGRVYPMADAIVTVSDGVGDDLSAVAGIERSRITTVYNPVVTPAMLKAARAPLRHAFFDGGDIPVVLGCGALIEQKRFGDLIEAFALVRKRRPARLVILGEAKRPEQTPIEQERLREIARAAGCAADLDLPGFVANPYAFMARANLFVLSSAFEGLPGVLVQAIACGCPAVSTDCPHGPREILEGGRLGPLVPVGDIEALAMAMERTLDLPPARDLLQQRGLDFTVEKAVEGYLRLLLPAHDHN